MGQFWITVERGQLFSDLGTMSGRCLLLLPEGTEVIAYPERAVASLADYYAPFLLRDREESLGLAREALDWAIRASAPGAGEGA